MLEFPCARHFCEEFLSEQIDVGNCLSFLLYADAYSSSVLCQRAVQCIAKNFQASLYIELAYLITTMSANHDIVMMK